VRGKETPTHSLLASKIQDKISAGIDFRDMTTSYTPYKAKMRVYGHVSGLESNPGQVYTPPHQERLYSAGFPSLSKKFRSDPVLSDCTEDYAEPTLPSSHLPTSHLPSSHLPSSHLPSTSLLPSASLSDNIYSMVRPPSPPQYSTVEHSTVQHSTAHYSTIQHSTAHYGEQPMYTLPHPPKEGRRRRRSKQHLEKEDDEDDGRRRRRSKQQLEKEEEMGCHSSLSSAERLHCTLLYTPLLFCDAQYCTAVYCIVLYCTIL